MVVFVKGDRNLKLKLAVLLTSQWYYLITLLAAKQYYATEEPGQELDILYTHSLSSATECLSSHCMCGATHKLKKPGLCGNGYGSTDFRKKKKHGNVEIVH